VVLIGENMKQIRVALLSEEEKGFSLAQEKKLKENEEKAWE